MKLNSILATLTAVLFALPAFAASENTHEEILSAYEKISTALANDDLQAAQTSAANLAKIAGGAGNEAIAADAAVLTKTESLDTAREDFKPLSTKAVKLAKGSETYRPMTCPMAKATWVQSGEKVMNPYMGKTMQQCGGPMESAKATPTGSCCPTMSS